MPALYFWEFYRYIFFMFFYCIPQGCLIESRIPCYIKSLQDFNNNIPTNVLVNNLIDDILYIHKQPFFN